MQGIKAMLSRRAWLVLVVAALGMLGSAGVASAATYTVNDQSDAPLASPTNKSCQTATGTCTLRAAVQASDNNGGPNTIVLPAGDYKLTIPPQGYPQNPTCSSTYDYGADGCDGNDPAHGDLDVSNGNTLTITGAGSATTTIDATKVDRAFAVHSGNGTGLSLAGVTIQNGQPAYGPYCHSTYYNNSYYCEPSSGSGDGGAIYSDGALSTTSDVVMQNNNDVNSGEDGGAIYSDSGSLSTLSIAGTTFTDNNAYDYGGAVAYNAPGTASITGSSFNGNYASNDEGGAIYGANGSMKIDSSTFSGNLSYDGGAIYWGNYSDLSVTNSTFQNNDASYGGVLYDNDASSVTLSHDRFVGNTAYEAGVLYNDANSSDVYKFTSDEFDNNVATYEGVGDLYYFGSFTDTGSSYVGNSGSFGGVYYIYDNYSNPVSLTNDTMSNNSSDFGGALYLDTSTPMSLTNDTITFNSASSGGGGGIASASDATTGSGTTGVRNTIIAENKGGDCGVYGGSGTTQFPLSEDSGYNMDSDGSCFGVGTPATPQATGDKINTNPLLNAPADNGGSNAAGAPGSAETIQTDAETSSSPSVDAGTNSGCPSSDARGVTRDADPCDMGAFELVSAGLGLTKTAPASANTNQPFNYTITASNASNAAGPSTGTTVVDQLPAGETLYGATPSQGSCSESGSPAKVTCDLGGLNAGSSATVTLVVTEANPGSVTNTATATNNEGNSQSASATTNVVSPTAPPPSGTAPTAITGAAMAVHNTFATLTGAIAPGGQSTGYFFQYGTNSSYGKITPVLHTGTAPQNVFAVISGLTAGTVYHYRLVAINDSGSSFGADRTFKTTGSNFLGSLVLDGARLPVKNGKVFVKFTCKSSKGCFGLFSVDTRLLVAKTHKLATVVCTVSRRAKYAIKAHKTKTVAVPIHLACLAALRKHHGKLRVKITTRPRSAQKGLVRLGLMVLKK